MLMLLLGGFMWSGCAAASGGAHADVVGRNAVDARENRQAETLSDQRAMSDAASQPATLHDLFPQN